MDIALQPGRYVVAVSGGVDSMVLLHALHDRPGLQLTVAHFDHGIRPDSREDRLLVQKIAREYGLPFVYDEGRLGTDASEAVARHARYDFLHQVRQAAKASALVTAHHQDDALETAILNLLRGTGRKGLTSLQSTDVVKRPMLQLTKAAIKKYADEHCIVWREDSTNAGTAYLRNHIRHKVLGRFSAHDKQKLRRIVSEMQDLNAEIDALLHDYLERHSFGGRLKRHEFIQLPHNVALEVMAAWLRNNNIRTFDKKMLERLVHAAKIHTVGKKIPITDSASLRITKEFLALERTER